MPLEQVNKLSIGTIPGAMWVVLEDDLVDCCKPGDDVIICGAVRRRWRPSVQTKKSEVELVLQANYIEVCNAQRSEVVSAAPDVKECFNDFWSKYEACPLKGRDQILKSVCPQVYGLHLVKLAVLLTIITGANHIEEDSNKKSAPDDQHSTRVRGQCHLLLVGDPGTGKSQLLRTGADLTARSVFTSGAGSTRAGLTCAALREEGEWQLEAGALVLSDGGVCCIDEISQLREHDRTAIHEAMEQQTISIAKAGIVCKLNTRCAIIAACNPKGHYDTDQPLSVNVSLGTPLLSRFDLIFILIDSKNKAWDKLVSSYILYGESNPNESKKAWNLEKIQMYISFVGPKITTMTKSANTILQSYYMVQRKSEHRDPSRTTVRMLDSLVRLSQAHCRLMYRNTILSVDAITAVSLVDLSMQDCTLSDTVDALHSTFHKYPDYEYLCTAKKLLTHLNLYEIWQEELLYYGQLLQVDHKTLEHDIDKGINRLFAKYDDVSDDNIVLSASLVTSSYFNNKKDKQEGSEDVVDIKENKLNSNEYGKTSVNENLTKTLKKHATLNKADKNPPPVQRNQKKRKEISVNTSNVRSKMNKRSKRTNINTTNKDLSESDDDFDERKMLKAVPSVNDVFSELGIDFKFGTSSVGNSFNNQGGANKEENNTDIRERSDDADKSVKDKQSTEEESTDKKNPRIEIPLTDKKANSSKIMCKLKQFEFVERHDLSKYEEKVTINEVNSDIVKLKERSDSASSTINQKSAQNSQISIFESPDCDFDLDI